MRPAKTAIAARKTRLRTLFRMRAPHTVDIAVGGPAEQAVETTRRRRPEAPWVFPGLSRRAQRAGLRVRALKAEMMTEMAMVDRELLVEPPGDARDEDRGDKDRREDQRDGHDRPGDLLHGLERRLLRRKPLLDVALHRLDDDDGVVDDQPDGEDEAEERQGVDREAEERKDGEGADEGDRHGQGRDQGRPPSLEEEEDHEDDEDQGLEEGDDDLVDPLL